jgi:hypothetical protein
VDGKEIGKRGISGISWTKHNFSVVSRCCHVFTQAKEEADAVAVERLEQQKIVEDLAAQKAAEQQVNGNRFNNE